MTKVTLSQPKPISEKHVLDDFDCGQPTLNGWLKKRALKNEGDASRTFVVCDGDRVVGFYAIAMGSVVHKNTPGKIRRNMPNPVPVMVLGRLAVDLCYKKLGIGKGLLKDAILRADQVNANVGFRALMVHALDEDAKKFYVNNGFVGSPQDELVLFLSLPVFKPLEFTIPVNEFGFDQFVQGCLSVGISCRLALIFFKAGNGGITDEHGSNIAAVVQSVDAGQIILAPGLCFDDIVEVTKSKWDCVAIAPIFSEDGNPLTRTYVVGVLSALRQKLVTGNVDGMAMFRLDGKPFQLADSIPCESAEYETDVN